MIKDSGTKMGAGVKCQLRGPSRRRANQLLSSFLEAKQVRLQVYLSKHLSLCLSVCVRRDRQKCLCTVHICQMSVEQLLSDNLENRWIDRSDISCFGQGQHTFECIYVYSRAMIIWQNWFSIFVCVLILYFTTSVVLIQYFQYVFKIKLSRGFSFICVLAGGTGSRTFAKKQKNKKKTNKQTKNKQKIY